MPKQIGLSLTHYDWLIALSGGAVLGLGAFLNKGCFFGTFAALVSGNINYIATLFGLSMGVAITHIYISNVIPSTLGISYVYKPMTNSYIWLTIMMLLRFLWLLVSS